VWDSYRNDKKANVVANSFDNLRFLINFNFQYNICIKNKNMELQNILLREEDGIIFLTINREKALNALNYQTFSELDFIFGKLLAQRIDFKGVIITGAGEKAFVAGADIKEFETLDNASGANLSKRGQDIFFLIERFHRPVIAAVNGFALGGGCELAMACHLRIAGEKARFGQPEVNLGILPGYGGTQRLVHYIGKTKAMELLLTADMIDANEAYRLGLVNKVVPQGSEVAEATAMMMKIGEKAPIALAKCIEAVNDCFDENKNGYETEYKAFGTICDTEDFKEGALAFLEKRKANFKGV
jgi:enoyl-CoA hydratase